MEKGAKKKKKKKLNREACARLFRAFFWRQFEGATAFPVYF